MLRYRLTFKGGLTLVLALLAFLLGGALSHPYLNLSGYALIAVLLVGSAMGTLAIRGVRVKAVAMRRHATSPLADAWVSLESRGPQGPFGLDLDGNPEPEVVVSAPDRVGKAFHLVDVPSNAKARLRSQPLGLVEITRQVAITWLVPGAEADASESTATRHSVLVEPDGRIREHRPGEGMRLVHWPLSARLQRLVVRVRELSPEDRPRPGRTRMAESRVNSEVQLDLVRGFTLAATMGAIAFLWQQGALNAAAAAVLLPLVGIGGHFSLRRAGAPSKLLLMALYVAILAILGWFVSDLRGHVLARGPIALTVMGIAALFAWDLRDRSYIRAQLFLVVFSTVLLPAFFSARDGQGSGIAFGFVLLALLLAAWAEGRHAIGALQVRFSELGTLSAAIVPFGFFAAMVLLLHPWLPAIPLPSLPTFGLSQVRAASSEGASQVPGQQGRLDLDGRWPQGNKPAVEVRGRGDRLRTEAFDLYQTGSWSASDAQPVPWPEQSGVGPWVRVTLRADGMRVLPVPPGSRGVRDALLEPVRLADGTFRLSRPAWIGYSYDAQAGEGHVTDRMPPSPSATRTEGSSTELRELARQLSGDAATPLEALDRIARHLRTELRYDLQAPEAPEGVDPVVYFLRESRRGFCVHFASALALLGRELGIPTRLVGGYSGGRQVGDLTIFDERHAHAWVEAYVEGRWVTLDPTPGGASMPVLGSEQGRVVLAIVLLVALSLVLWRRQREPRVVRSYRRMLKRLQKLGAPVTEATTPGEALTLARTCLDAAEWERFRELVGRYEAERFARIPRAG
jgi:transglutaminase-like putative cysteine protease